MLLPRFDKVTLRKCQIGNTFFFTLSSQETKTLKIIDCNLEILFIGNDIK